jgi:hypothetical protein
MNEWDRRIREHRVWAEMETLGSAINYAFNVAEIAPETIAGLERLRTVLAYCGKRLAAADPLITIPGPLEEIASSFVTARGELQNFASNQNAGHVQNSNLAADRALAVINQVPGAYSPEELGALVSITTEYRSLVDLKNSFTRDKFQEFSTKADAFDARLGGLAASLQTEQQKLAQVVTDYQGQFSAAQEKRNQDYTDAQGIRQTKFNETVSDYSKRLSDQDSEFSTKRNEMIRTFETNLSTLNNDYVVKAQTILNSIQGDKQHVEKLVGVIGNLGVTSGYLRTANRAQWAMWMWQALTVSSLITLSGLAYHTLSLLEDGAGHFNWGAFAGRVLLLVSLGVIAAYSGSQADKLFVEEKRNRKLALELEAIGPYLAPLPIEEQNKFRTQIGDRSFGRDYEDGKSHRKSPVSFLDILRSKEGKELLEILVETVRRSK